MSGTKRLASTLDGYFDNQDMKDLIASLELSFGQIFSNTASTIVIAASDTDAKANTASTAGGVANDFTEATTNRLTYTGAPTKNFMVSYTATITPASGSAQPETKVGKNGTAIAQSFKKGKLGTGQQTLTSTFFVSLATNDYLELFLSNETGTEDLAVQSFDLSALEMFG